MMMSPQQTPGGFPVLKAGDAYGDQSGQGNFNYQQAQAYRASDPRGNAKPFTRGGISAGLGQAAAGAATAANAYSTNMAQAYSTKQNDQWENANTSLQDATRRNQYQNSLAGLQERDMQSDRTRNLRNQQQNQGVALNLLSGLIG